MRHAVVRQELQRSRGRDDADQPAALPPSGAHHGTCDQQLINRTRTLTATSTDAFYGLPGCSCCSLVRVSASLELAAALALARRAPCDASPPRRPISDMCSRFLLTTWPPLRPAARASSGVNSCAVPCSCAARPPLLAISRWRAGSMLAKPRWLVPRPGVWF